jgi:flavin reductase (DIM6/NTAB) family NADH-FMN oxidoreductase RutF
VQFELDDLPAMDRYELLLSTVVPRPIGIVTTFSKAGVLNAAPYSLFSVVTHDPPVLMFSVLPHPEQRFKDTAANILATREFTISLVAEGLAGAMNTTCIDAPPGIDELRLAGLETMPSAKVAPPWIAGSPVAFECRFLTSLSFAANQATIFGRIVAAHVADRFVVDPERALVDTPALDLIGGMHAGKWYARLSDRFEMDRPSWAERGAEA